MSIIKKYKLIIIGIIVGAIAGYLYYYFVGCASGTCGITSKPINSTIFGALLGGFLFDSFKKQKAEAKENNTPN